MGRSSHICFFLAVVAVIVVSGCAHNNPSDAVILQTSSNINLPDSATLTPTSEDYLPQNPTVRDYVKYALLHNSKLKSAFEEWKAALMKIPQVKALPDPKFTYAYYIKKVETRVGPQEQRFALSQTFPWLSKLMLAGDVAAAEALAKKARYESIKWDIVAKVKKTFFDYVYLLNAIGITQSNLEFLRHLEMAIQTKYASSTAAYASLLRLQTEMGRLEDRIKSLKDLLGPTKAELNSLLNRAVEAPLPVPQNVQWPGTIRLTEKEALKKLEKQNPELKILEAQIEKAKKSLELSKKKFYPDLTVSLTTIDTNEARNPSVEDSGKDPFILGFSVNVPIWWKKYEAAIHEAHLKLQATQNAYENKKLALKASLKKALFNWNDAERKIDLYENGLIPKANQAFQVSLKNYETGEGSYTDVIDIERMLLEFQLNLEEAKVNRAKWLAEIERILGEQIVTEWTLNNNKREK